ncbi:uncharacterized protein HD556DRAFT_1251384, partial [Suillus plorans]
RSFWQRQVDTETPGYRNPPLPPTRIKKVINNDPDVNLKVCRSIIKHFQVFANYIHTELSCRCTCYQ